MRAAVTVDVEEDIPPFFKSFRGIMEGLPRILNLLDEFEISGTFFVTADISKKFPDLVGRLAEDHEIACHGFRHRRLDRLGSRVLQEEVSSATGVIKAACGERPVGFRAPRLRINETILRVLKDCGYQYDSSVSVWHPWQGRYLDIAKRAKVKELPISADSLMLRIPFGPKLVTTQLNRDPFVLCVHTWEAIRIGEEISRGKFHPLGKMKIFWNLVGAGEKFLNNLRGIILALKERKVRFARMKEL